MLKCRASLKCQASHASLLLCLRTLSCLGCLCFAIARGQTRTRRCWHTFGASTRPLSARSMTCSGTRVRSFLPCLLHLRPPALPQTRAHPHAQREGRGILTCIHTERERERERVCVCVKDTHTHTHTQRERERERERESERASERQSERKRGREGDEREPYVCAASSFL